MSGDDAPVRFEGVTHAYGAALALDQVSFEVPRGGVFALLGRNGAGKTTALRALAGLLSPTRGRVSVLGADARELAPSARARLGFVGEGHPLPRWMRVRDVVRFQAATFPTFDRPLCDRWLARFGLPPARRVFQLSRGMRAQLALAVALAPRPELLVLDDPALGLDTVARREFLEVMIELLDEEGRTVLFTSHVLPDVERIADRVALLDRGVLRVDAPLDELKARVRRWTLAWPGAVPDRAPALPGAVRAVARRGRWMVTAVAAGEDVREAARAAGAAVEAEEALSLEDTFIEYASEEDVLCAR